MNRSRREKKAVFRKKKKQFNCVYVCAAWRICDLKKKYGTSDSETMRKSLSNSFVLDNCQLLWMQNICISKSVFYIFIYLFSHVTDNWIVLDKQFKWNFFYSRFIKRDAFIIYISREFNSIFLFHSFYRWTKKKLHSSKSRRHKESDPSRKRRFIRNELRI